MGHMWGYSMNRTLKKDGFENSLELQYKTECD